MAANLIWTALTEGKQYTDVPYSRRSFTDVYAPVLGVVTFLQQIIPSSPLTTHLKYVDELTRLVFRSSLVVQAEAFDPSNSYKVPLSFPVEDPVLRVDWSALLLSIEGQTIPFGSQEYRDIWLDSELWNDKISAVILDMSKQLIRT